MTVKNFMTVIPERTLAMSNTETNGADVEVTADELRSRAIKECGDWIDRVTPCLEELKDERDRLNNAIMVVHESRLTWLERLAGVMMIDVRRAVFDNRMGLYWADTDGNILRDEETDEPLHLVDTIEDLAKLTTTNEVVSQIASGEASKEGEVQ